MGQSLSLREPRRSQHDLVANAADHLVTIRVGYKNYARRQWIWWSIAAVALVVGVVSLVGMLPTRDPKVAVLNTAPVRAMVQKPPIALKVPRFRPVRLEIPALNINTYVGTLGLKPNHQIQVPTSTHVVDWYKYGATPGQVGSSVILGHVDSFVGPGTFFYLKTLKSGDSILVVLANGTTERFVVSKVVQYAKSTFPDHLVYGSNGTRALNLVTCGGTFDHATGSYESNVVVFSHLVSVTPPKK